MNRVKGFARHVVGADKDPKVQTVSTAEFLHAAKFNPVHFVIDYLRRLFPILGWITRYNLGWLSGDLIAGTMVHLNFKLRSWNLPLNRITRLDCGHHLGSSKVRLLRIVTVFLT